MVGVIFMPLIELIDLNVNINRRAPNRKILRTMSLIEKFDIMKDALKSQEFVKMKEMR